MKKDRMIVWDFDGPIVDSCDLSLEVAQYHYHDVTEDTHRDLFNGNFYAETSKLRKKEVSAEAHEEFMLKVYGPKKLELLPVPGIKEVLEALGKEYLMVINSSARSTQIGEYLRKNGLDGLFEKIYGNEIKSKEEKLKKILHDFSLTADNCVFITDALGDVLEAREVLIPSIAVLWGFQQRKHFEPVKDEVIFAESPADITKVVKNHFKN